MQKTILSPAIWPVTRNNVKSIKAHYIGLGWHYVCSVMCDTPEDGGMIFVRRNEANQKESLRIKAEGGFGGQFVTYYELES